jgi:branched-chain amino acid transport system ATP-binding protein
VAAVAILSVSGVSKAFRGLRALHDVGFEVAGGEILGVIGANGAGKTTLFNVMAGALPPDSGRVVLDGHDITGAPAHHVARAGMVRTFQLMRPFASMSVLDNVCVAAMTRVRSRRVARDSAADVVTRVGLDRWRDARAGTLPTAGLKRLELARALATRPRVLLLDEVLAGLTPAERDPVLELLAGLRTRDGLTMILIEHIMAAVMRLSDRVLVLDQGGVLTSGTPQEVTSDPRVIEAYLGEEPGRVDAD